MTCRASPFALQPVVDEALAVAQCPMVSFSRRVCEPRFGFLVLRIAWLNWLAALVVLFTYPVAVLEMPGVHDPVVLLSGSAGAYVRDDCAPEAWLLSHHDWSWYDLTDSYPVWLPLLLAVVVPTVLHVRRRGRLGVVFDVWPRVPGPSDPLTYRATVGHTIRGSRSAFVHHVRHFIMRMVAAMLLSVIPFYALLHARLIKNYGCVSYSILYSIPEYVAYAGLMLIVVLVHAPSPRQVFGASAKEYETWRNDGGVLQAKLR